MTPIESIVDRLRGRRLMLILDNCEHVMDPVVELVGAVAHDCPTVTVLATSREPLGVDGERVVSVPPLTESDRLDLFCDRAAAADESVVFSDADVAAITAICGRLDGIPLAIELAAARIRSLTPTDLLSRLDDRFRLLRGSGRGLERHQTLRATVAWSYELLSGREQLVFDRVSVFAGGFDLASAAAVLADDAVSEYDVVDILGSLVDKSMVIADRGERSVRYRLLEMLRQYGEENLHERVDMARMRDRHLLHYVDLARRTNRLWLSPRQLDADEIFDREWDNLRAAHTWTLTKPDLDAADLLVAATGPHANARRGREHADWAARTLALDTSDRHSDATTYGWAADGAYISGDFDAAIELARRGIAVASAPGSDTVSCWNLLAQALLRSGRDDEARVALRHAHIAAERSSDLFSQAQTLITETEFSFSIDNPSVAGSMSRLTSLIDRIGAPSLRAWNSFVKGRYKLWIEQPADAEGALVAYREGLDQARRAHDSRGEALCRFGMAFAAAALRTPDAGDVCHEVLSRAHRWGAWSGIWLLVGAVAAWLEADDMEAAAVVYGHLDAHQPPMGHGARRGRAEGLRRVREHDRADEFMARGAEMDRDRVLAYVLERLEAHRHRPAAIGQEPPNL